MDQPDRSEYDSFTDTDNVSDWAVEAMIWAVDRELIRGIGNGMLAPEKTSTRAQVAQIIKNYEDSIS